VAYPLRKLTGLDPDGTTGFGGATTSTQAPVEDTPPALLVR
jgi:hypothetical protein